MPSPKHTKAEPMTEQAAPTVNLSLTPQEAQQVVEALNVAVKASGNALEAGSYLIPIAIKITQAQQALAA